MNNITSGKYSNASHYETGQMQTEAKMKTSENSIHKLDFSVNLELSAVTQLPGRIPWSALHKAAESENHCLVTTHTHLMQGHS
jgi:hypothetical protein